MQGSFWLRRHEDQDESSSVRQRRDGAPNPGRGRRWGAIGGGRGCACPGGIKWKCVGHRWTNCSNRTTPCGRSGRRSAARSGPLAVRDPCGRGGHGSDTDPRLLVALWVYATLDAVAAPGSGAAVGKTPCLPVAVRRRDGEPPPAVGLSFQGGDKWDALLTQIVAALLAENLVTMQRVAQDGMRCAGPRGKVLVPPSYPSGGVLGGRPSAGRDAETAGGRIAGGIDPSPACGTAACGGRTQKAY